METIKIIITYGKAYFKEKVDILNKIIVGRKVLTPYFKKTPPTLATPFSNSVQPPRHLPCHLQIAPPLLFLLPCLFCWMGNHITFDVLFYLMIVD